MAKCKYPNEVCANMTVLHGETYCDSVPCSLKDEVKKHTNADRIRNMSDEELAEFLTGDALNIINCCDCDEPESEYGSCIGDCKNPWLKWLKAEAKEGAE